MPLDIFGQIQNYLDVQSISTLKISFAGKDEYTFLSSIIVFFLLTSVL